MQSQSVELRKSCVWDVGGLIKTPCNLQRSRLTFFIGDGLEEKV